MPIIQPLTATPTMNHNNNDEFETINFDDTSAITRSNQNNDEIDGYDPKQQPQSLRRHHQHQRYTSRCKCVSYLFLVCIITISIYFITKRIQQQQQNKNNSNIDFTNELYTIRINTGAMEPYYDNNNHYWLPDSKLGIHDDFVVSVVDKDTTDTTTAVDNDETLSEVNDLCPITIYNSGNETDLLYCTDRTFDINTIGRYEIAIPKNHAQYQVTLYFIEYIYDTIGQRQFDIVIEDTIVQTNYDILQHTNHKQQVATNVTYIIPHVNDGYVSIVLQSSKISKATISGIVVQYRSSSSSSL
jgi:hypothetical protein